MSNDPAYLAARETLTLSGRTASRFVAHLGARAQARFYLDVNDKTFSPLRPEVGQFAAAVYQSTCNIQPSLDKMFQWRRDAWHRAMQSL